MAWNRAAQASSDRAGLINAGDPKAATNALFKMTGDICKHCDCFDVDHYLDCLAKQPDLVDAEDINDELSGQLLNTLRVKAMQIFSESEPHAALFDVTEPISAADRDDQVAQLLTLEAPSYLEESSDVNLDIRSFLINGGLLIAQADHEVTEDEINALLSVLGEGTDMNDVMEALGEFSPTLWWRNLVPVVGRLAATLPVSRRFHVMRDLTYISLADGKLDVEEREVLYTLSHALLLKTSYVDSLLDDIFA